MNRPLTLATVALFALTACTSKTPSATPTADTVLTPTAATSAPPSKTPTGSPTTSPPKSSPAVITGPHIAVFRIKVQPRCTTSGPGGTFNGNGPTLEWAAVNVDQVTISIDGPGIFGTYDPVGSQELPFGCGPAGTTVKHKYLLRTVGGGPVQERTIEAEAKAL